MEGVAPLLVLAWN